LRRREFITLLGSAASAWPLGARAQQPAKLRTVGFLNSMSENEWLPKVAAFRQGLEDAGFTDGRNVTINFRWGEHRYDRLPALALELVQEGADVIFASGGDNAIRAALDATSTLPIVFTSGNDPVAAGYVKSLNHPGGHVTGISFFGSSLEAKRFELLHEIAPQATVIAVLMGSGNARTENDMREIESASNKLGLKVRFVKVGSPDDIGQAFRDIIQHRDEALQIVTDPLFGAEVRTLAALTIAAGLPASSNERDFVTAGGLMSYGASLAWAYRSAGSSVGRILKGENPAEIPVQEPTKFELVISLKAARTLGLAIPQTLLATADEVIE
jgi:putative tryptophan/tyrosine transport system substrate-binding protein